MIFKLGWRFLRNTRIKLLLKFMYTFGWKGMRSVSRFKKRLKRGRFFPAFLFLSITDNCNLSCRGCWVSRSEPSRELDAGTIDDVINQAKKEGCYFFGILGGEPLLYKDLAGIFSRHKDCYFLLFTNGIPLDKTNAMMLRKSSNVTPVISIEGLEQESDTRRGGHDVYRNSMLALDNCRNEGLITGVATSICKTNIDELLSDEFVDDLLKKGIHYLWYYIYRPVGPDPAPELVLSPEEVTRVRRFIVEKRRKTPMMILDAYWDHQGKALCPAATGMSVHISPGGAIEPCPPIQFAAESVQDDEQLADIFNNSLFLKNFMKEAAAATRGCVLLENPDLLLKLVNKHGAEDSSGRNVGTKELVLMNACSSHNMEGHEISEKHWLYRFAKKHWFFGFGAYG